MKGYFENPDETEKTIKDGWLCTGDIGVMESDGFFRIIDRLKDVILISGFNVYPKEIEDYVSGHPKILECAAIGIPDETTGEVVKLFIVKKDESLTEAEVQEFCKKELDDHK